LAATGRALGWRPRISHLRPAKGAMLHCEFGLLTDLSGDVPGRPPGLECPVIWSDDATGIRSADTDRPGPVRPVLPAPVLFSSASRIF